MKSSPLEIQELKIVSAEVAGILRALGNERRLMILCKLAEGGELNVTMLAEEVGLSPSALSQHLTKLRARKIVDYRRDSQILWYRISDPRIESLFHTLHGLFCGPQKRSVNTRRKQKA